MWQEYEDIVLGSAALLLGAAGLWGLGRRVGRQQNSRLTLLVLAVAVGLLVGGFLFFQDRLLLAKLIPWPGVMVWGVSPLPLIALLAGLLVNYRAHGRDNRPPLTWVGVILLALGVTHAARPFFGQPPPTGWQRMVNGVVMQTSYSTCGAASLSTMLLHVGIPASETEMAEKAFTREEGTSMLGVYRALKKKTANTPWKVRVLTRASLEDLRKTAAGGPVLISVGLPRFSLTPIDPRYELQWGWTPGSRHGVVLFRFFPDGSVDIGDPDTGRERWQAAALKVLWNGEGVALYR